MYYTSEEKNYRKYGIVILEVYDETLRTTFTIIVNLRLVKEKRLI